MVGRECCCASTSAREARRSRCLEVQDLDVHDDRELEAVRGLSLSGRGGRDRRAGRRRRQRPARADRRDRRPARPTSGTIAVDGQDSPARARATCTRPASATSPTDRQHRGLVLDFTLAENMRAPRLRQAAGVIARLAVPDPTHGEPRRRPLTEFDVRGGGPKAPAASLSGGNQQKVVIAREISRDPAVLVASQPTRGLDVGAIDYVHRRLIDRARRGPRDPARLARARGGAVALRPHPRDLRRPHRGRVRLRGRRDALGGAMLGGGSGAREHHRPSARAAAQHPVARPPSEPTGGLRGLVDPGGGGASPRSSRRSWPS